jgi:hypothetical protein
MANCDLLAHWAKGDTLSAERNVDHWVFFEWRRSGGVRNAVEGLGFCVDAEYINEGDQPYAIR